MKKSFFFLVLLCCGLAGSAQKLLTPPASPPATLHQQIGLTKTTLICSRPSVSGRKIFGELIPFGQIWRTGANEATRIRFDQPVLIGENKLQPGAYGVYSIPGETEWIWVFSRDTSLWGDRSYNPDNDVFRLKTRTEPLVDRVETLEFRWMNLTHQGADLVLEWENTRARLPVQVYTNDQVAESIQYLQGDKITGDEYYRAARYYLDNGLDRMQALRWINKRIEKDGEQFGVLRYKALLELELGDTASATATMNRSLDLARTAGNTHYIRMNEQSLKNWTKTPAPLSAENILARSIVYHDPEGKWQTGALSLSLYESRPGGEKNVNGFIIPSKRNWYTHQGRLFLGSDEVIGH